MFPWKIVATIVSLAAISITALILGQLEIAAFAAGALVTYLGRMNGSRTPN